MDMEDLQITKTKEFKEKEKKLPKEVRASLEKALKSIAKNPYKAPHSMSVFGEPSHEELKQWMGKVKPETIDLVLEYLGEKGCLTKRGKALAHAFWKRYIEIK
ncbi:MAG: hypothetical protein ACTSRZ_17990 [Promethearchaeota archaeon]